ncbi:EAL domain-containing protein [Paucibacter sp. R3-3]|uniref:EAL domain-containing protein n=1 Tax=Roseateles agri TaxID=3098619 RepID=A0ABU5DCR3_9BURK|nr:EAL domain-containing protein [Paucibacter sp. R3-3]MDY0743493.1 EAL domain-containing protein [Paucibacter sp. R3-3]
MDAEFASPEASRKWASHGWALHAGGAIQARLALWVTAIREAYVALLPLTVVGALALSLASVPYPPFIDAMSAWFGPGWMRGALLVFQSTMGMMGLFGAMSVSARTMNLLHRPDDSTELRGMATVASVAAAVFVLSVWSTGGANLQSLGYVSAFQSLVVGVATAEVILWLNHRFPLHTELNVLDTGVHLRDSLHLTFTAGSALLLVGGGYYLCSLWLGWCVSGLLPHLAPWFQSLGPEWLNMVSVLFNQLLWAIGVNGGQLLLHLASASSSLMAPEQVLWSNVAATPMFMNAFAHLGGAGATWGLILYCAFRGRDANLRRLALYSIVPALFNVNELLLFGIPLVLSRSLLLPFILAPLANCAIALVAFRLGFIVLDGQAVPWSMPMLVSGYLMTESWHGTLVQLMGLVVSTAIYAPFLRQLERLRAERHGRNLKAAMNELMRERTGESTRLIDRPDAVGAVARCLHRDFQADLGSSRVRLAYQPQHDADGRVVGVEALLRWTHASFGPIPPAAIINIAEECELIHDIGGWVLDQACADTRRWRDAGFAGFKVSINMSPRQLDDPAWATTVWQALRRHGVSPQDLDIEITEGQSLSSSPQSEQTLQALQAMGVALSMDDFGMGCTSLLYMHRFRLHSIKLDGRLTREVLTNEVDRDIVRCIAGLGRAQHVHVIAEFVETAEQQALLQELGCDMFQGWHYSPAIPAADLTPYVANWENKASALHR